MKKNIVISILLVLFSFFYNISNVHASSTFNSAFVDTFIQRQMSLNGIPGLSTAVIENNKLVYVKSYGNSDSNGSKVTNDTPFVIGSLSKSFTATAVLQLMEMGKIDIDKPIKYYIPYFEVANSDYSKSITVRELLNQTSGIPVGAGDLDKEFFDSEVVPSSYEQTIYKLKNVNLNSTPGSTFEYSNINYIILGQLIQTVSNQSYEDYVKENILIPLHMNNTFFTKGEGVSHGLAKGFEPRFGFPLETVRPFPVNIVPAGAIISTANDMSHYLSFNINNGIYNGTQILSSDSMKLLHEPPQGTEYAMGWIKTKLANGDVIYSHDGAIVNYYTSMYVLPKSNSGIIVLTNYYSTPLGLNTSESYISAGIIQYLSGNQNESDVNITAILLLWPIKLIYLSFYILILYGIYIIYRRKSWIEKIQKKKYKKIFLVKTLFFSLISLYIAYYYSQFIFIVGLKESYIIAPDIVYIEGAITIIYLVYSIDRIISVIKYIRNKV